jgi:hypothetical protein
VPSHFGRPQINHVGRTSVPARVATDRRSGWPGGGTASSTRRASARRWRACCRGSSAARPEIAVVCSCRRGYSRQHCHGKFRPVRAYCGKTCRTRARDDRRLGVLFDARRALAVAQPHPDGWQLVDELSREITLAEMAQGVRRSTPVARFASAFRSRRRPLAGEVGAQVLSTYLRFRAGRAEIAKHYVQAMPFAPDDRARSRLSLRVDS